jgi:pyruvate dehydrogenase E1 component beta subunit
VAQLTYREAIAAALLDEMDRDERVVMIGEDLGQGGVFKTTKGAIERFGRERVWDTPISETAIVGAALGAAMAGMRPVAEIMFSDFYACCWDQVVNEIAKIRYMTGGQLAVPLVIRSANGGGLGFGAQHSQAVENWAMCVPGLKIAAPSTPADAYGLLAAAIRDDDPVLVFEHKGLFATKGDAPEPGAVVGLGEAAVLREGRDVTLAGLAATVPICRSAADELAEQGVEATVLDLRTLVPLDAQAVLGAVRRTSRLVIVEENPGQLGWGSAVAALVAEEALYDLDAPIVRISAANVPLPAGKQSERIASPTVEAVVKAVADLS